MNSTDGCACAEKTSAYDARLSLREFGRLGRFISEKCGIRMPPGKKTMLEGRLRKRLRTLGMDSFEKYREFLLGPEGQQEFIHFINEVTTNKTDFFRESAHFDQLVRHVLPELSEISGLGIRKKLNVWSAGCSTGEEPYTLAMVLSEFAETRPGFRFSIFASDISTKVLDRARLGIYAHDKIEIIPMPLRKKYLLRSRDRKKGLVRIVPELRSLVTFERLNFMDGAIRTSEPMGIIFCRNVLIYFDRPTQEEVLNRLCSNLVPGGYLFTGHSETLHNMRLPLEPISSTVYRKR